MSNFHLLMAVLHSAKERLVSILMFCQPQDHLRTQTDAHFKLFLYIIYTPLFQVSPQKQSHRKHKISLMVMSEHKIVVWWGEKHKNGCYGIFIYCMYVLYIYHRLFHLQCCDPLFRLSDPYS